MGQLKGQGYFYGKPEDAEATRQRLADLSLLVETAPMPELFGDDMLLNRVAAS